MDPPELPGNSTRHPALVLLHLDPRFLQKTPWNLVVLADKPLELVFGLDYVF